MTTQPHELQPGIVYRSPNELTPNPQNVIHADLDPRGSDAWLLADIQEYGVIDPITIFPDGEIHDGHRRRALAILAKCRTVPTITLASNDRRAAFRSAQLARRMSLYAFCLTHADRLADLIQRGVQVKVGNAVKAADGVEAIRSASDKLAQEWIQTESVSDWNRRSLIMGCKLIQRLDEMRLSANLPEREKAERVTSIFRNRGLKPALRMLNEKMEAPEDDGTVDCGAWQPDADEEIPVKKPRVRVKRAAREPEPAPETVAVVVPPDADWTHAAKYHLDALRALLRDHECLSTLAASACDHLDDAIAATASELVAA